MFSRAQSGLEYLMTYGWALVLIIVVGSVLFFIMTPSKTVNFSVSNPTKLPLKAALLENGRLDAKIINGTGSAISLSSLSVDSGNFSNCTVNGSPVVGNIPVNAGGVITVGCDFSGVDAAGLITFSYTDFSGMQKNSSLKVSGTIAGSVALGPMPGWSYRKKITISQNNVDAVLSDFPLLVKISNDADIGATSLPTGFDLRFTASDGTTLLSFEREDFSVAGGQASGNVWVKVPVIDSAVDTEIYLYYGNSVALDGSSPSAVWDASFNGVWHSADASATTISDSTSVANTGTKTGTGQPFEADGKIRKAQQYDGSNDTIAFVPAIVPTNTFSFSAWIKTSATHEIDAEATSAYAGVSGQKYVFEPRHSGTNGGAGLSVGTNGISVYEHGDAYMPPTSVYSASIGTNWNYISVNYIAKRATIYLNGVPVHTGLFSPKTTVYAPTYAIGGMNYGYFNGLIDEVRISNIARSAAWIKFEYNNMNSANNETTWGAQETV